MELRHSIKVLNRKYWGSRVGTAHQGEKLGETGFLSWVDGGRFYIGNFDGCISLLASSPLLCPPGARLSTFPGRAVGTRGGASLTGIAEPIKEGEKSDGQENLH